MKYDNDGCKDEDTQLINNANIYDNFSDKQLTIKEIVELQLFINPIDGSVWKMKDNEMQPYVRYDYTSW